MNRKLEKFTSIVLRDFWALTISPPMRTGKPTYHYVSDRNIMTHYLNTYSDHYIMYPEFTNDGRLHYHGIVYIKDKYKFYHTKHYMEHIGFSMWKPLKTHKDHMTWLIYCLKERYFCRLKPIIYDKSVKRKQYTQEDFETKEDIIVNDNIEKYNIAIEKIKKTTPSKMR